MQIDEAAALIRPAVAGVGASETWAELGAGSGTFTRALALLLGPGGRLYAVDRDRRAVDALRSVAGREHGRAAAVTPVLADFTQPLALLALDGVLLANALHFVHDGAQRDVLARVADYLRPGGRLVVAEYDGRSPSRWVPYPVPLARFRALAAEVDLGDVELVGERRSAYGGRLYAAVAARPAGA